METVNKSSIASTALKAGAALITNPSLKEGATFATSTALKAGATFVGTLLPGVLLALLVGGGVAWLFWSRYHAADGFPTMVIGILLFGFILVYGWLSFLFAKGRALHKVVSTASAPLAERLTTVVAERLEASPLTQNRLGQARQLINDGSDKLDSLLGDSKWIRRTAKFALNRLPWSDLLADWATDSPDRPSDEALRASLPQRIASAVNEIAEPSLLPLIVCVVLHVALFALGVYLA